MMLSVKFQLYTISLLNSQSFNRTSYHTYLAKMTFLMRCILQVTSLGPGPVASLPPLSSVEKWTMPKADYEKLQGTVLAQKKAQQIGRFDPHAPEIGERKLKEMQEEVERRSKSNLFCVE